MKSQSSQGQLFIGLFILIMGVFALIDNLNFLHVPNMFHFWPTIFIVFGLLRLVKATTNKARIWSVFFIVLGSLLMLDDMGVIHFDIRNWWPAILIFIGVKMLMKDKDKENTFGRGFSASERNSENTLDITALLGASEASITTQDFRFGDITAIMGGVELDFRQANIVEQAMLDVTSVMGGVVLKIPREWIVINQITPVMGGVQDKSMPTVDANKRLILTGAAVMGGVEIKKLTMNPFLKTPMQLLIAYAIWMGLGALLGVLLARYYHSDMMGTVVLNILNALILGIGSTSAYFVSANFQLTQQRFYIAALLLVGASLLVGAIQLMIYKMLDVGMESLGIQPALLPTSRGLSLVISATAAVVYAFSLVVYDALISVQALKGVEQRETAKELWAKSAELKALRAQINPHFYSTASIPLAHSPVLIQTRRVPW